MAKYATYLLLALLLFAGYVVFKFSTENSFFTPVSIGDVKEPPNLVRYDFQNWHEYSAPNSKFTVLLPALPQHATKTINGSAETGDKKYETYVSQKNDGSIFMISLITFTDPDKTKNPDAVLDLLMKEMVDRNSNNKLKDVSKGKFKDFDTLNYSFANSDTRVDAKSFVIDETVYILTRAMESRKYTPDEFNFFVNSFEIPNSAQEKEGAPHVGE